MSPASGTIDSAGGVSASAAPQAEVKTALLDLSAATLNQNAQHDGEQDAGNNANYGDLIHSKYPFSKLHG
jgi:hypothetical protein